MLTFASVTTLIELFAVAPHEDDAFLAAWAAEAPPGATLYRALRDDVRLRYASVAGAPKAGVVLIVAFESADDRLLAAWEATVAVFAARQGFLGAQLHENVGAMHWSSPLMYARAVREEGDLIAAMPFASEPALYVGITFVQDPLDAAP